MRLWDKLWQGYDCWTGEAGPEYLLPPVCWVRKFGSGRLVWGGYV